MHTHIPMTKQKLENPQYWNIKFAINSSGPHCGKIRKNQCIVENPEKSPMYAWRFPETTISWEINGMVTIAYFS